MSNNSMNDAKYKFSWDIIGDVELGRPKLGPEAHVHVYRLMQYCLGEALFSLVDSNKTKDIHLETGLKAAAAYYDKYCDGVASFEDNIDRISKALSKDKLCLLSMKTVGDKKHILTVSESVGLLYTLKEDSHIYDYMEGFITGLAQKIMGPNCEVTKEFPSEQNGNNYIFHITELN